MFWFGFIKYLTCVKDFFTIFSSKANTAHCILELGLIRDISPVKTIQLSCRKMDDLSAPRPYTWQGGLCAAGGRENLGDVSDHQDVSNLLRGQLYKHLPQPPKHRGQCWLQGSRGSHRGCFCPKPPLQ